MFWIISTIVLTAWIVIQKVRRFRRDEPTTIVVCKNEQMYHLSNAVLQSSGYEPTFKLDTPLAQRTAYLNGRLIINLPSEQWRQNLNDPGVAIVMPCDSPVTNIHHLESFFEKLLVDVDVHINPDPGSPMEGKITLLNFENFSLSGLVWGFRLHKMKLPAPPFSAILKIFWYA